MPPPNPLEPSAPNVADLPEGGLQPQAAAPVLLASGAEIDVDHFGVGAAAREAAEVGLNKEEFMTALVDGFRETGLRDSLRVSRKRLSESYFRDVVTVGDSDSVLPLAEPWSSRVTQLIQVNLGTGSKADLARAHAFVESMHGLLKEGSSSDQDPFKENGFETTRSNGYAAYPWKFHRYALTRSCFPEHQSTTLRPKSTLTALKELRSGLLALLDSKRFPNAIGLVEIRGGVEDAVVFDSDKEDLLITVDLQRGVAANMAFITRALTQGNRTELQRRHGNLEHRPISNNEGYYFMSGELRELALKVLPDPTESEVAFTSSCVSLGSSNEAPTIQNGGQIRMNIGDYEKALAFLKVQLPAARQIWQYFYQEFRKVKEDPAFEAMGVEVDIRFPDLSYGGTAPEAFRFGVLNVMESLRKLQELKVFLAKVQGGFKNKARFKNLLRGKIRLGISTDFHSFLCRLGEDGVLTFSVNLRDFDPRKAGDYIIRAAECGDPLVMTDDGMKQYRLAESLRLKIGQWQQEMEKPVHLPLWTEFVSIDPRPRPADDGTALDVEEMAAPNDMGIIHVTEGGDEAALKSFLAQHAAEARRVYQENEGKKALLKTRSVQELGFRIECTGDYPRREDLDADLSKANRVLQLLKQRGIYVENTKEKRLRVEIGRRRGDVGYDGEIYTFYSNLEASPELLAENIADFIKENKFPLKKTGLLGRLFR